MSVPYTFATASGNIPLSQLDANFSNVKNASYTAATVTTAAQPNITSVGTLTSLTVSSNISASSMTVSGNITASNFIGTISGNIANAVYATTAGTVTTNAQSNITSVGTLTSLTVSGNISGGNVTGTHYGSGAGLTSIPGGNVSGTVANATYASSAGSATTAGTVTTAAQSSITSVGTLTSLGVTGNITSSANISGSYILGNGSQLTGVPSGPLFMANVSTGQGVPTSPSGISQLPLVYDNVIANIGGDYAVGNSVTGSIFTASVPGFYQVSSSIGVTPSNWANVTSYSSLGVVGVYVNDNPVASGPLIDFTGIVIGNTILQVTTSSSISTLIELNDGDTVKCQLAYLTTAPSDFWNTSTNLVQGYFQAAWIRS